MKIFEPGKIGKVATKNRIVMAPMGIGGLVDSDGRMSQRAIDSEITINPIFLNLDCARDWNCI